MAKTLRRRNYEAKELWSGKYPAKVIEDKRAKLSEAEVLKLEEEEGQLPWYVESWDYGRSIEDMEPDEKD